LILQKRKAPAVTGAVRPNDLRKQFKSNTHGMSPKGVLAFPAHELTKIELGLKRAILEDARAKKAFANLVKHGYQPDILVTHLTMWARSAEVWKLLQSGLLTRDGMRRLDRFAMHLRRIADELATDTFHRELRNPKLLRVHRIVRDDGGRGMARSISRLPDTLRCYARLVLYAVSIRRAFGRRRRTLPEHQAAITRVFFDEVKRMVRRDRVDSVVPLFNVASAHFGLGERFEKKALSRQLKRLRSKTQAR
jgi:hypothetical protein